MSGRVQPKNYELKNINDNEEEDQENGKMTKYLAFCLGVAAFGAAFQFGWSIAALNTSSGPIQDFYKGVNYRRTGDVMSLTQLDLLWSITNGLVPLGAMFGGLSSGLLVDRFGRKNVLIMTNLFVVISSFFVLIVQQVDSYEILIVARFVTGLYIGLFSGTLPLYLSELSPKNLRGSIGTLNQLLIVTGVMMTNIFGLKSILGTPRYWPLILGLCLVPTLVHYLLVACPETPKHLYINLKKPEETRAVLMELRNNDTRLVEAELRSLETERENLSKQKDVSWGDLFTQVPLRRALIVALGLMISQQFSGINAVIAYSTNIFKAINLPDDWPAYGTIILGVVQVVMTIVCMFIIEKAGRKILLLIGFIGMCLSCFGLALASIFGKNGPTWLSYMTIVFAVLYMVFFSIGPGAIPWLMTSELFNSDARGKANSLAVFTNWFCAFIVTVSFPFIEKALTEYSFIVFGALLILFSIFVFFFIPETKNKTTEKIIADFEKKSIFMFK